MNIYGKRSVNAIAALGVVLAMAHSPALRAQAQADGRNITMLISYPAGGIIDQSARIIAAKASAFLGQNLVPVNQSGAAGRVALETLKRAKPDGTTIGVINNAVGVTLPLLDKSFAFDPTRDVTPIIRAVDSPYVLVARPGAPFNSFSEFLDYARKNPRKVSYGSAGAGGGGHLAVELMQSMGKIALVHAPYKGEQPALLDVAGGHVDVAILAGAAKPLVEAGKLTALATTASTRWQLYPNAPTVAEAGLKDYAVTTWIGYAGPPAMPAEIVVRFNDAFNRALRDPEVRGKLAELGLIIQGSTPQEFTQFIKTDFTAWEKVIREAGIKLAN